MLIYVGDAVPPALDAVTKSDHFKIWRVMCRLYAVLGQNGGKEKAVDYKAVLASSPLLKGLLKPWPSLDYLESCLIIRGLYALATLAAVSTWLSEEVSRLSGSGDDAEEEEKSAELQCLIEVRGKVTRALKFLEACPVTAVAMEGGAEDAAHWQVVWARILQSAADASKKSFPGQRSEKQWESVRAAKKKSYESQTATELKCYLGKDMPAAAPLKPKLVELCVAKIMAHLASSEKDAVNEWEKTLKRFTKEADVAHHLILDAVPGEQGSEEVMADPLALARSAGAGGIIPVPMCSALDRHQAWLAATVGGYAAAKICDGFISNGDSGLKQLTIKVPKDLADLGKPGKCTRLYSTFMVNSPPLRLFFLFTGFTGRLVMGAIRSPGSAPAKPWASGVMVEKG